MPFFILRSSSSVLHPPFSILRSPFSVLHFPFSVFLFLTSFFLIYFLIVAKSPCLKSPSQNLPLKVSLSQSLNFFVLRSPFSVLHFPFSAFLPVCRHLSAQPASACRTDRCRTDRGRGRLLSTYYLLIANYVNNPSRRFSIP